MTTDTESEIRGHAVRETERVEQLLLRAKVLRPDDAGTGNYYRSRPEKWAREVRFCETLEDAMRDAGIDPVEGWEMTFLEIAQHLARRDARRGLTGGAR